MVERETNQSEQILIIRPSQGPKILIVVNFIFALLFMCFIIYVLQKESGIPIPLSVSTLFFFLMLYFLLSIFRLYSILGSECNWLILMSDGIQTRSPITKKKVFYNWNSIESFSVEPIPTRAFTYLRVWLVAHDGNFQKKLLTSNVYKLSANDLYETLYNWKQQYAPSDNLTPPKPKVIKSEAQKALDQKVEKITTRWLYAVLGCGFVLFLVFILILSVCHIGRF